MKAKTESSQKIAEIEKSDLVKNAQILRRALDAKQREHEEFTVRYDSLNKECLSLEGADEEH